MRISSCSNKRYSQRCGRTAWRWRCRSWRWWRCGLSIVSRSRSATHSCPPVPLPPPGPHGSSGTPGPSPRTWESTGGVRSTGLEYFIQIIHLWMKEFQETVNNMAISIQPINRLGLNSLHYNKRTLLPNFVNTWGSSAIQHSEWSRMFSKS